MVTEPRRVVMGRILGPFGVKGWVKIQSYTEEAASLSRYPVWWVQHAEGWREIRVAESELHGDHLVARLQDCVDRDAAGRFSGAQIAVNREAMPEAEPGEFYWTDLVDLKVVNRAGENLGRVAEIFDNGAHPIMRVAGESGERLLPFIETVVVEIDEQAGEIRVDWGADW